ncbi:acyltransferase family protein [Tumidithrix elongata RA019]|uniref:Acyltransferase family protein n=1 Tax=Tumidithrix elongata BACA0141 TaxID=2716417 RepID=A0AAW9Q606_9CYAN|nr:acyltransferase family protein [Tumidithrix elongata RA019]
MSPSKLNYRPDIDGIRALAVIAVIIFHAFPLLAKGGFVGVDIFFVISGYLITGIIVKSLKDRTFSFKDFYARRIRRIFPALIVVLIATWFAGWLFLTPTEYVFLGKHITAGALFGSNIILANESGYFDSSSDLKPLLNLWSLGVEEQFYLLWPVILFVCWRKKISLKWIALGVIAVSFSWNIWTTFLWNIFSIGLYPYGNYYLPFSRFWEILAGGLLIDLDRKQENLPVQNKIYLGRFSCQDILSIVGFAGLLVCIFGFNKELPYPGVCALVPIVSTMLLLAAGSDSWINRNLLGNRYIVFVGLVSYPLYLWHWPVLAFARIISYDTLSIEVRLICIAITVTLAMLTYFLVEKSVQSIFSRKRVAITSLLCTGLLLVVFLGLYIGHTNGFEKRFPALEGYAQKMKSFSNTFDIAAKSSKCFFVTEDAVDELREYEKNNCLNNPVNGKPYMLLVGDSHAASIFPGVYHDFEERTNIGRLMAGYCIPMIENLNYRNHTDSTDRCQRINAYIFSKIREAKPDILLVDAYYLAYALQDGWSYPNFISDFVENINQLKVSGLKHIIVIGQVPTWKPSLREVLERSLMRRNYIAERSKVGLDEDSIKVDSILKAEKWKSGVYYIPIVDNLCDQYGCLTMVGKNFPNDLITLDYGHLTEKASIYIVKN